MIKPLISVAVALLAAAPATAQDAWPVDREGSACSTSRLGSQTSDGLEVRYNPASQEITLQTVVENDFIGESSGTIFLWVIFDKGRNEELDIAWGYRQFAVQRDDGLIDLATRFSGAKNVDQLLSDLASSRRLGIVLNSKTVADFDLAGIGTAIAGLRNCARSAS